METAVVTTLITGSFAMTTALGSVWLKHYLEQSRTPPSPGPAAATDPAVLAAPGAAPAPATAAAPQAAPSRRAFAILRPILVLVIAFGVGAAFRQFKTTGTETLALVGLYSFIALAFLGLVLNHRRSPRGIWPYQLDCLALWAAFASGYSLVHGRIWSDLIASTVAFWLGFAVLGGLIVWFSRPRAAKVT